MKKYLLILAVSVLGLVSVQTNANRGGVGLSDDVGTWTEWKFVGAKFSVSTIDCHYSREFFPNNGNSRYYKVEKRTFTKPGYPNMSCPKTMNF